MNYLHGKWFCNGHAPKAVRDGHASSLGSNWYTKLVIFQQNFGKAVLYDHKDPYLS